MERGVCEDVCGAHEIGHACSRAIRAHFLTEIVPISHLLQSCEEAVDLKSIVQSIFVEDLNETMTVDVLAASDVVKQLHSFTHSLRKSCWLRLVAHLDCG